MIKHKHMQKNNVVSFFTWRKSSSLWCRTCPERIWTLTQSVPSSASAWDSSPWPSARRLRPGGGRKIAPGCQRWPQAKIRTDDGRNCMEVLCYRNAINKDFFISYLALSMQASTQASRSLLRTSRTEEQLAFSLWDWPGKHWMAVLICTDSYT